MQQTVGGDDVVEGLGFGLGIDGASHVGQVAKNVEGIELEDSLPFNIRFVNRAFHTSSSVFIEASIYPLREYMVRSVDSCMFRGSSTCAVQP